MDKQVAKRKALKPSVCVCASLSPVLPASLASPFTALSATSMVQLIDDIAGRTLVSASTVDKELRDDVKELAPPNPPPRLVKSLQSAPKPLASRWSALTAVVVVMPVVLPPWQRRPQ